jgi:hypothetical protein
MPPRASRRNVKPLLKTKPALAALVVLMLGGCTSIGDFGRLQPPLVADNIHAWVGQEAATRVPADPSR